MESQKSVFLFVPEEGYESITIMHGLLPDKLCGIVNKIFKELVGKLSSSEITVENSLKKTF